MNNVKLFHNEEYEKIIIGAILYENENSFLINQIIDGSCFYSDFHKRLFVEINRMIDTGNHVNVFSLSFFLTKDPAFKNNPEGARKFLNYLNEVVIEMSVTDLGIKRLCNKILDLKKKRLISKLCYKISNDIDDMNNLEEIKTINDSLVTELNLIKKSVFHQVKRNSMMAKNLLNKIKESKNSKELDGLATGFNKLDDLLNGLQDSSLVILGARPSMGKTALALSLALGVISRFKEEEKKKKCIVFISLEMSAEQLIYRIVSMKSRVNMFHVRMGYHDEEKLKNIYDFLNHGINDIPLIIEDSSDVTVSSLRSTLITISRKNEIACVFIDYLQLLNLDKHVRFKTKNEEITEISRSLKAIAREFKIPIVALSQLSRALELREDKRPQLSDLRESGSIEQDADVVMFLYREAYYEERNQPKEEEIERFQHWCDKMQSLINQADLIVAKNRNGAIRNIRLFFNRKSMSFGNYSTKKMENKG